MTTKARKTATRGVFCILMTPGQPRYSRYCSAPGCTTELVNVSLNTSCLRTPYLGAMCRGIGVMGASLSSRPGPRVHGSVPYLPDPIYPLCRCLTYTLTGRNIHIHSREIGDENMVAEHERHARFGVVVPPLSQFVTDVV